MGRFDGKVIAITGGGSGLGRLSAMNWAAEGAKIVVSDVVEPRAKQVADDILAAGGAAVGLMADVRSDDDMAALVRTAVDTYGRLDIMFANAGKPPAGFGGIPLEDVSAEDFRDVNAVIYDGVFYACRQACRQMKLQGTGGNIVVTASAGGHNAYPGFGPYNAGKSGVLGLVKSMAYDWGRFGIRVNGLSPTHGMSVNFAMPPETEPTGMSYEEASLVGMGPTASGEPATWDPHTMFPGPLKVNRPPALQDNANVATFLASDDSQYMSGIVIPSCDGGSFARTSIPIPEAWTLTDQVT